MVNYSKKTEQFNKSKKTIFELNDLFKKGSIHEAYGPSPIRLAIILCTITTGPIIWIRPKWEKNLLNPDGIWHWFNTQRLLFINANSQIDFLWAMEQSLVRGIAPLIISELPKIPSLTQIRRLNLAAKKNLYNPELYIPIVIILTDSDGVIPNIESRWRINPLPFWNKEREKIISSPQGKWLLERSFSKIDGPRKWMLETITFNEKSKFKKFNFTQIF